MICVAGRKDDRHVPPVKVVSGFHIFATPLYFERHGLLLAFGPEWR
jgi:hypothetical protein